MARPAFPAPSDFQGGTARQNSGASRGEIAKLWLLESAVASSFETRASARSSG